MSRSDRPCRKPGYRLEIIDNELLLFHPTETVIMYCNETASLVWRLCDGERTTQEIIDLLAAAFPEEGDRIAADVESVLTQFSQHSAIELT